MTSRLLAVASDLAPAALRTLRTLDAIHLASALALGSDLAAILPYDDRLAHAAQQHRVSVLSPA